MRIKAAFSYQLKNYFKSFGWVYLWSVAVVVILPFLISLLLGRINIYDISNYLPQLLPAMILSFYLFVFGGISYDGFKLFIQNGIGRKTYFFSKLYALTIILVVGEVINVLYGIFYHRFINAKKNPVMTFSVLYGHYFNSAAANAVSVFIITILFIACIMVTGMVIGSCLGLFSRRMQRAIIVGAPIVLFVLLAVLVMLNDQTSLKMTWIGDFLLFIVGMGNQSNTGHFVAFAPMLSGAIYFIVMLLISYRLTLHFRVPR
ncbi:hypothetical protein [Secundilactobacillus yichangensis]|uniref:hypothetical protein n=1 Tax=Secundilactobacillus yichangensis TaxID=2799580 RepID=UPI0019408FAE|nr:hypothetical protein [Secundilactobacillus yichangensis]